MKQYYYLKAVLLGTLLYPILQVIFYSRFGRFNTMFAFTDLLIPAIGIALSLLLFYLLSMNQTFTRKVVLWFVFIVVCAPAATFGIMIGGLLGPVGMLLNGLMPSVILLLLTVGVLRLFRVK